MKKSLLSLAFLIFGCLVGAAQSLRIYEGNVVYTAGADDALSCVYTDGSTLTVAGRSFEISLIDSLTVVSATVAGDSVYITYSESGAVVEIPSYLWDVVEPEIDGADVTLTSTATEDYDEVIYLLSGSSSQGSFTQVGDYKCSLVLNDLTLTSVSGAAINIDNGKRIEINIPDGTTTTLADYADGSQKACLRVKGHAELKGGGTLNITGNCDHAYKSGEYTEVKKSFGTLNIVKAANDGMHVGQYFLMNGGTINIGDSTSSDVVAGDGLQVEANLEGEELDGQMFLNGGVINIYNTTYRGSGIKADSTLWVTGGEYNITTTGLAGRCVEVYDADISDTNSMPVFTLYAEGGTTVVDGDTKKSACFKTDGDLYIHAGIIYAYPTGEDANGVKVGGDYYRTSEAQLNVTPKVDGTIYTVSE